MEALLRFSGRLNRAPYWAIVVASTAILVLTGAFLLAIWTMLSTEEIGRSPGVLAAIVAALLLDLFLAVVGLSASVRRLHDRGKTGWWLLILFGAPLGLEWISVRSAPEIAFVGLLLGAAIGLWALVELGFLPGVAGPNRYGPDPLARR